MPLIRPSDCRAFESKLERHCALGKEFAVPTASTVQLHHLHLPTADEIERCGLAVFTARSLTAERMLVGVTGEVDASNSHELGRFVTRHTRVSKQLILDLSAVDFFG